MKGIKILTFNEYKVMNEELNFTKLTPPPKFKELTNSSYSFKVDGNDIDVSFKNNVILTGIKKSKYIERIYRINMSFQDVETVSNPKQILDGVNYCTELYLTKNNIDILAIVHIPNSPNVKDKNKRAFYNKLYLEPMAKRLGYEYKIVTNTDPEINSNIAFSFIYKKSNENNIIINKIINEELSALKVDKDIDDFMNPEFAQEDDWLDNY